MIPTRVHGVLDYVVALAFLALPWAFGWGGNTAPTWVLMTAGAATFLYSLLTNYELGITPAIPMRGHLALDAISGLIVAASPWMLGFSGTPRAFLLVAGLVELVVVAASSPTPVHGPRRAERAKQEQALDEAGRDSFPASDPPAMPNRRM